MTTGSTMHPPEVDTAIFLGAGASKAEGAPLQGRLFTDYFSSSLFKKRKDQMNQELATFFLEMFQINVRQRSLTNVTFPTFEEVLGLTDLAILRKEGFRGFDSDNQTAKGGRLRFIAQHLVFLVAKVLDLKLQREKGLHRKLVEALREAKRLHSTVFVSTNYDILIDNALSEELDHGTDLDYGVDFRNFDRPGDWTRPVLDRSVRLFKPHGSLNWLFCPTCNELDLTPNEKGVVTRLSISTFRDKTCDVCRGVYVPLIVPPTFYKDMTNAFLSAIWNRADITLRKVKHIVFCGYSFPDADTHIKYLLKRAQTNRDGSLKVTVINHYRGKKAKEKEDEKARYQRFLGRDVEYTKLSFEKFAANPMKVI